MIKRTIDHKTVHLYVMFNEELNAVKKEFNCKFPSIPLMQPRHAGLATWARCLKRRIDRPMKALEAANFLHHVGMGEETCQQYQQLAQAIDEFIGKTFNDWVSTVEKELWRYLEVPLMSKAGRTSTLDLSFSKYLLKLFSEIRYWERLRFEIPHYAHGVYSRCEELRSLRENVLLVVRDYNRIILELSPEERALFRERIRWGAADTHECWLGVQYLQHLILCMRACVCHILSVCVRVLHMYPMPCDVSTSVRTCAVCAPSCAAVQVPRQEGAAWPDQADLGHPGQPGPVCQ